MLPPHDWPARRWETFQANALMFCRDGWAAKADAAGWQAWELWGCHKQASYSRIQGLGLVPMINGATLTGIDDTMAVMMTKCGSVQRYRRKQKDPLYPAERCLVWELA